ncbi:MAG TPA: LLM class flavin-dependent oxidoreductase [Candidatus Dormibacteraeota bacterium]|nr:LLM class flavin-dependent oxidoreductase [Candidatus Dormibacteraeota bacterium]
MHRLAAGIPPVKTLEESVGRVRLAEKLGYESVWTYQLPGTRDASLVLAAYAAKTERIKLATGVLPIYTRHPTAMVQMAATLDELSGGRFILGIGVSHRVTVESMWGLQLHRPVEAMREYLTIVRTSLREGACNFDGDFFTAHWAYSGPRRVDLSVMISALNPRMLELAGELADGVVLYMCPPRYIQDEVIPAVRKGREKAGKTLDGFEIVAAVDACVTPDRDAALDVYKGTLERYASLPFYRRAMEAGGFNADELAAIGDAKLVRAAIARYREAGVTLPAIGPFGGRFEATLEGAAES